MSPRRFANRSADSRSTRWLNDEARAEAAKWSMAGDDDALFPNPASEAVGTASGAARHLKCSLRQPPEHDPTTLRRCWRARQDCVLGAPAQGEMTGPCLW